MARKKKKTGVVSLDFSGVESRVLVKEGEYLVKVSEVTEEEGDKAPYLKWKFGVSEGKFEGSSLYYITSLSEKSLWNLKSLLEALNVELPEDAVDLDLSEMVDLELMVTVEHDTYEGKKQARIVDFWAADGDKEDDKKGSKKSKKSKGKKKAKDIPDEDAINDMDEDELKEVIEEHSLEIDADDFPKVKALRKEVIKALEDAGDEEEDEDDKKSKGKSKGKKKGKKDAVDQDAINEMDEDELEAFVEEHELEVKLSKYKTLRKKQAAVIDAGTEAGVVED